MSLALKTLNKNGKIDFEVFENLLTNRDTGIVL